MALLKKNFKIRKKFIIKVNIKKVSSQLESSKRTLHFQGNDVQEEQEEDP